MRYVCSYVLKYLFLKIILMLYFVICDLLENELYINS